MEHVSKPTLEGDLFLLHAPRVFDIRERDDILYVYLSDTDSVNVTPIYEMFPLGFFSIKSWLAERSLKVEIVNIASLMLMYPRLEVRKLLGTIHPSSTTIFGGLSATMYAEELIRYPGVDVVVKGYDTPEPIADIVTACKSGHRSFGHIPNLVFKDFGSNVSRTRFSHRPRKEYNDATVDWSFYRDVKGVMVWFFIGMPKQTPDSVLQTVAYSERLMEKFGDANGLTLVCGMVPFLDPGSRFFDQADRHGYRIFHLTLEEHRRAMVEPLWYKRLNYETSWMSRKEIQDISYDSARWLVIKKGELGFLPRSICERIVARIDEAASQLREIEHSIEADGVLARERRDVILTYNREIFSHSTDQIVPVPRAFGGRWYDDFGVPREMIQEVEV